MNFVQTRHGALHYLEIGSGAPLVLLHGNTYGAVTQERLAARFADEHRVISVDLLGHGQSARPENLFTTRYFAMQGEAIADLSQADQDALEPYAGSQLDTGPEAKAYADHYILAHMNASSDGRTYAEVSSEFVQLSDADKASPEGQALGQLRQTLFMGNTLRGLLLNAYAFATIGTIAGIGAIVAFGAGLLLLVLVALGFWHARRVEHTAERTAPVQVPQHA